MAKFVIAPHMRLHEWVARDKGYFDREGLDYEFRDQLAATPTGRHDLGNKVGAYQTFERGATRTSAAPAMDGQRRRLGRPRHSSTRTPIRSRRRRCSCRRNPPSSTPPISPGARSRSATSGALRDDPGAEQYLKRRRSNCPRRRPFVPPHGIADRRQCRPPRCSAGRTTSWSSLASADHRLDLMMASLITGDPDRQDVGNISVALRLAQRDIDLRPELYTIIIARKFPPALPRHDDTRRWGPGERIVFEPTQRKLRRILRLDRGARHLSEARWAPASMRTRSCHSPPRNSQGGWSAAQRGHRSTTAARHRRENANTSTRRTRRTNRGREGAPIPSRPLRVLASC